jgi:hypothetical protein
MLDGLKRVVKAPLRTLRALRRQRRIRGLVDRLRGTPPDLRTWSPLLAELRAAWGNEGWTADLSVIEAGVARVIAAPGNVLECGGGLSTVVFGVLAEHVGGEVWALEQGETWARATARDASKLGLRAAHVIHGPLVERGGAAWYDFDHAPLPSDFTLVFCDGPAVFRSAWPEPVFLAWRGGVVAELRRRGISFRTIVLDDGDDRRCEAVLETWRELGLRCERVDTDTGPYVLAEHGSSADS